MERSLPDSLDQECAWIQSQGLPVVVLGDIPPSIARLADRLGAPLVWMGNFGWDDIYDDQGEAFAGWVVQARRAYRTGDLLLRMPFHLSMAWGIPEQPVGLVAARPRPLPRPLKEHLLQVEHELVLVVVGGLGCRYRSVLPNGLSIIFCANASNPPEQRACSCGQPHPAAGGGATPGCHALLPTVAG